MAIFSGDKSRELWDEINRLSESSPLVWNALYSLGCKCQELEAEVERLKMNKTGDNKTVSKKSKSFKSKPGNATKSAPKTAKK